MATERHRVVIVGGGFGGLLAAQCLRKAPVEVTLLDRTNHHLFQPLLYQASTGILSQGQIAPALRSVLRKHKNIRVELVDVTGFDLDAHTVVGVRPDGHPAALPFDSLIIAAGGQTSYFGHDELGRHSLSMKTLDDALILRERIFGAFEMAETEPDAEARSAWMTFAVVGGGPTGCEIAGQIAELGHRSLKEDFRAIDPTAVQVILIDAGKEILATFGDKLAGKATNELEQMGVQIRTETKVASIDQGGVEVDGPQGHERIASRTVVWAAGVQASPLGRILAEATGAERDRAGRVSVQPDCTLPGHPEVFAVGDMMSLDGLPGVAEVAMQQGIYAARTIRHRVEGKKPLGPFRYRDLGSMAAIGRRRAIVDFHGLRLSGWLGWLGWLFVHLLFLTSFRNRFTAVSSWAWSFIGSGRGQRALATFTVDLSHAAADRQEVRLGALTPEAVEGTRVRDQSDM